MSKKKFLADPEFWDAVLKVLELLSRILRR